LYRDGDQYSLAGRKILQRLFLDFIAFVIGDEIVAQKEKRDVRNAQRIVETFQSHSHYILVLVKEFYLVLSAKKGQAPL
jgi:hypothetical protein